MAVPGTLTHVLEVAVRLTAAAAAHNAAVLQAATEAAPDITTGGGAADRVTPPGQGRPAG